MDKFLPPIPESEWFWMGHPGHFIASHNCLFRLCTKVGPFIISTVGDYRPHKDNRVLTIGASDDHYFETQSYLSGQEQEDCGCYTIKGHLLKQKVYATAKEATDGHMELCRHYAGRVRP